VKRIERGDGKEGNKDRRIERDGNLDRGFDERW
jgi:hypothetical protein